MQHINTTPIKGKTTTAPTATTSGSTEFPVTLEEFYTDPTTKYWYKKYSDGWIEQGGYYHAHTSSGYNAVYVTFPSGYEFVNAPIYIECQPYATGTGGGDTGLYGVSSLTEHGFYLHRGSGTSYNNYGFYWIAKGI